MTPMTGNEINASPDVVVPAVLIAITVAVLSIIFRRALMEVVDELAELWRTYGPVAARKALDRRPRMPQTPWFCARCRSMNGVAASRCYSCGAKREEAAAPVPTGAEPPAGPSAGLTQRTRQKG